jgi:hypothetical protein
VKLTFFDRQDDSNPLNGRPIELDSELLEILSALRNRPPFLIELAGDNGYNLMIGIGEPACVQHGRSNGDPPYLMALGPHAEGSEDSAEYLMGNTPTPGARRYSLPFAVVEEIACQFQRTGERSSAVSFVSREASPSPSAAANTTAPAWRRAVGEVILPAGRSLNRELVRADPAWWCQHSAPHDRELERLESQARAARRWLRAVKNPVPPWEWRRAERSQSPRLRSSFGGREAGHLHLARLG